MTPTCVPNALAKRGRNILALFTAPPPLYLDRNVKPVS
jgi:hypothetical protein